MKERTFYTINLDIKRILFLSVIFILIVGYVFLLGRSIGKKQGVAANTPQDNQTPASNSTTDTKVAPEKEKAAIKNDIVPSTDDKNKTNKEEVLVKNIKTDEKSDTKKSSSKNDALLNSQPKEIIGSEEESSEIIGEESESKPKKKKSKKKSSKKTKSTESTTPTEPVNLERSDYYTIQVGAYSTEEAASKVKSDLSVAGDVSIQKQGEYHAVRIGQASSKKGLDKILSKLPSQYKKLAKVKHIKAE